MIGVTLELTKEQLEILIDAMKNRHSTKLMCEKREQAIQLLADLKSALRD